MHRDRALKRELRRDECDEEDMNKAAKKKKWATRRWMLLNVINWIERSSQKS